MIKAESRAVSRVEWRTRSAQAPPRFIPQRQVMRDGGGLAPRLSHA
jgi:hypothetical protein